jgi:hypothetical protein
MPTLALYTQPDHADAPHHVHAPGGYEWWHFLAEDRASDRRFVASFYDGYPFHPTYLSRYERYISNPTRFAPPIPRDYPAVAFSFYEGEKSIVQLLVLPEAREFALSRDGFSMAVGQCEMTIEFGGAIALRFRGVPWQRGSAGPTLLEDQTFTGDFVFAPRWQADVAQHSFASEAGAAGKQHWLIARPSCDVRGELHLYGQRMVQPMDLQFTGLGFHDHYFAAGPLMLDIRRWIGATMVDEDRTMVFRVEDEDGVAPIETLVIELSRSGHRILDASEMRIEWAGIPRAVRFGEDTQWTNPRVLQRNLVEAHMLYDVQSRQGRESVLCEMFAPGKLESRVKRMMWRRWLHRASGAM